MRAYDGVDYRYTSDGSDKETAAVIIRSLIGFRPGPDDLGYSLSLYAGGTGIDDRLALRCQYQEADWPLVTERLRLVSLKDAADDPEAGEEFRWLIGAEGSTQPPDREAFRFINAQKHDFQDEAGDQWEVFFSRESDVNCWCAVWRSNRYLNYLSFDQG